MSSNTNNTASANTNSNAVQIKGNIGQVPVLGNLPSGAPVLNFNLGENTPEGTKWHEVSVYGNRATYLFERLERGMFLAVSGVPSTREYKTKAGEPRTANKFRANWVTIIPRKPKAEATSAEVAPATLPEPPADMLTDDDIPF